MIVQLIITGENVMKNKAIITAICIIQVIFSGCRTSVLSGNLNIKPFAMPEDKVSKILEDYNFDFSDIKFWDTETGSHIPCGNYDPSSNILNLNVKWKAAVFYFNDFDASNYRYIRFDYEPNPSAPEKNLEFRLQCIYSDNSKENILCERKRTRLFFRLNGKKKKSIKQILIWCITDNPVSYKINKLCFTQNKIIPPPVIDSGMSAFNDSLSAIELVKNMKLGWNLGNTFDAHSFHWEEEYYKRGLESEFHWCDVETTRELIDFPYDSGYKTIRIPVTWFNHIIDDKYTIDPDWMMRVKSVVDMAINKGYYVILNEHHSVHGTHETRMQENGNYEKRRMPYPLTYADGYIVSSNKQDQKESKAFLKAIWTQIATAFNNGYDEHLIFETMNEPRNTRDYHPEIKSQKNHEWQPGLKLAYYKSDGTIGGYWCDNRKCPECLKEYNVLNEYNQVCLDAIRATGGNNSKRFVMIPGLCTGSQSVLPETEDEEGGIFSPGLFKMPQDSASDKLILTIHKYPGFDEDHIEFKNHQQEEISCTLSLLNDYYVKKGIPVVIGETGANKLPDSLEERKKWISFLCSTARKYGMSVIWWDCGSKEDSMAEIDRINKKFYEPDFVQLMIDRMSAD